jgi:Tfp pilus assembly protein PilF
MRYGRRAGALGLALLLTTACAAKRAAGLPDWLVRSADGADLGDATFDVPAPADEAEAPEGGSARAPAKPIPVRPTLKTVSPPTIEGEDPSLAAALVALAAGESSGRHRAVAAEYRRVGVVDRAEEHLTKAIALSPRDAAIVEERARLWRDAGTFDRALSDAHRAAYMAPASAEAQNTLGTVLYALGRVNEARRRFREAAALDPRAAYPRSNLCYAAFAAGDLAAALSACDEALALAPDLEAARRNRGLVAAALQRTTGAKDERP